MSLEDLRRFVNAGQARTCLILDAFSVQNVGLQGNILLFVTADAFICKLHPCLAHDLLDKLFMLRIVLVNRVITSTFTIFLLIAILVAAVPQAHDRLQIDLLVARENLFPISLVLLVDIHNLIVLISLVLSFTQRHKLLVPVAGMDSDGLDQHVEVTVSGFFSLAARGANVDLLSVHALNVFGAALLQLIVEGADFDRSELVSQHGGPLGRPARIRHGFYFRR